MDQVTEEDKQNIKVIWDKVYPSAEETGQAIVIRLFVDFPKTKNYFKKLKDISTLEEMQASAGIKAHGKRVMNAFNQIFSNMDNWSEVCTILDRLANRHRDGHQVDVYNFEFLFEVVLNVLTDALGCTFTPDIKASWKKLFSILNDYIASCYAASPQVSTEPGITVWNERQLMTNKPNCLFVQLVKARHAICKGKPWKNELELLLNYITTIF